MYAKLAHGEDARPAARLTYLPHRIATSTIIAVACFSSLVILCRAPAFAKDGPPNFIIFFTDDQGYNDVGCFGSPLIETPNFDRMADEGTRFTDFYVQPVCGVSRAALMTGCYPIRVAEVGNRKAGHPILHPDEITMAEVLKTRGYATGLIGKWHLAGVGARSRGPGTGPFRAELMPGAQGFDYFFGTPLHNGFTREVDPKSHITELMRNDKLLESPTDMDLLTQKYTQEAVRFITENRDRPFFLYLAHNMPHVPLGASKAFRGKSRRGLYGDVIQELDWSAGQVLDTLKRLGIDDRTLMVFTSDNGPWVEGHLAGQGGIDTSYGSADPLRGCKMTTHDGGPRVPCIMRWPGKIPAGRVCGEMLTSMDLLPTFARLAGAKLPDDRTIDGMDASPVVTGVADAENPRQTYFYYCYNHLQAVRHGRWKLVQPRPARPPWCSWSARMVTAVETIELYDLDTDIGEKTNLAEKNPEVVAQLSKLIEQARADLGDYDRIGQGARFFDDDARRPDALRWQQRGSGTAGRQSAAPVPYDKAEPVGNLRFDFETATLQGWKVVEGRFDLVVSDRKSLPNFAHRPFNKQGKYHLSTVERSDAPGAADAMTGVVQSPTFTLKGKAVSFLVGGGDGPKTYVALCTDDGKEVLRAGGPNGPVLRRIRWDVGAYTGRKVFMRIVDRKQSGWGHITFDDFSADGELD